MSQTTIVLDCDEVGKVIGVAYDMPDDDQAIALLIDAVRFLHFKQAIRWMEEDIAMNEEVGTEQARKEFDEAEDSAMIEGYLKWANGDDGIETEEDL